ncbi:MAG TPA: glycosyl hydrolase family 18 protein, partial [Blastocatellia bacterium]|nr:glycosyl hydrolase family 18 protein [Blastocatellia bacterium]
MSNPKVQNNWTDVTKCTRTANRARKIGAGVLAVITMSAVLGMGSGGRSTAMAQSGPQSTPCGSAPSFIGYWHNFQNQAPFIKLGDVSPQFDVINIAFATPASGSTSSITFTVNSRESESDFIADVSTLHGTGKKVVLSIGGANAVVELKTGADIQNFVESVTAIVSKFGFDGVDIDFESGSIELQRGDTDFRNPTTPVIVNLIQALHQLKSS